MDRFHGMQYPRVLSQDISTVHISYERGYRADRGSFVHMVWTLVLAQLALVAAGFMF